MATFEAGRELDALIAEKYMGWSWVDYLWYDGTTKEVLWFSSKSTPTGDDFYHRDDGRLEPWGLPQYSTNWSDAGRVLDKLQYNWNLYRDVGQCGDDYETSGDGLYRFVYSAPGMPMQGIVADTAPLAICRAVLKAKENGNP